MAVDVAPMAAEYLAGEQSVQVVLLVEPYLPLGQELVKDVGIGVGAEHKVHHLQKLLLQMQISLLNSYNFSLEGS